MHPLLAGFSTLLLDLNGTFMFDQDRFGEDENYHGTYRDLGGQHLERDEVAEAVSACCDELTRVYHDPGCWEAYPSVADVLQHLPKTRGFPAAERTLLERVIAQHEVGTVPPEYAAAVRRLAKTHRLALVSNVWSRKDLYVTELRRCGVLDLFAVTVFSAPQAADPPAAPSAWPAAQAASVGIVTVPTMTLRESA